MSHTIISFAAYQCSSIDSKCIRYDPAARPGSIHLHHSAAAKTHRQLIQEALASSEGAKRALASSFLKLPYLTSTRFVFVCLDTQRLASPVAHKQRNTTDRLPCSPWACFPIPNNLFPHQTIKLSVKDVMEPVLLGPPRTPSRATSAGPSPSQRSSMEDADSSVTRKRPRLDSGDRAYRSMSAEALHATAEPGRSAPSKGELGDIQHSTFQEPDYLSPPNRTPSKVTINVRDPTRNGRSDDVQRRTNTLDLPETADKFVEREPDSDPPNAISISSSPTRSPEIEVAEVEDMDEDTGDTKWRPLVSVVGGEGSHEALLDSFPFALESNNLMEALAFIAQAFEKGKTMQHCAPQIPSADCAQDSLGDGSVLRLFAEWIERYLQETEQQPSRWWDFYTEEREFWEEIPYVVECLLRRGLGS